MMQVAYILLGFLATVGVVFVIGQFVLAWLKLALYRQEQPAMAIVLGSAVWSLLVFFFGCGTPYPYGRTDRLGRCDPAGWLEMESF